ncbi:MAG: hypothetical protein RL698_3538 [Pseudomonadota bacterium]|jgi:hypothetical protein
MTGHVIDTNVLLVASAAEPYSPFDDSHVPPTEQLAVLDWLAAFRADESREIVIDDLFRIYQEYRNKLTDQDYGMQVVHEKLQMARFVALEWDADGNAIVPPAFAAFDSSDRKLLAAALVDPASISVVNAADSDWLEIETELEEAGVTVVQVLDVWLRAQVDPG